MGLAGRVRGRKVAVPERSGTPAAMPAPRSAEPVAQQAVIAPRVAPQASAATAPAAAQRMPAVQAYTLPTDALMSIAQSSGLQWVNSDAQRIAAVQAAIAAEPAPIHVPRERPAPVVMDTGPLILVETKRDLRNMTLPFEQSPMA